MTKFSPTFLRCQVTKGKHSHQYGVMLNCREPGEDMWETIYYHRNDLTSVQAERLIERIYQRKSVDLTHWTWSVSRCAQYGFLHESPGMVSSKKDA